MNTIKLQTSANWADKTAVEKHNNILDKFIAFEDSQAKNRTAWFLVSLVAQGVLFLPVPAALMYYYNAPIFVLIITMALFFANVIAGMGGSGIRTMISLFAVSILVHLILITTFVI